MSANIAWIDDPKDAELQKAWNVLLARFGSADGWQYMGSKLAEGVWTHCFRNKQKLEEAENAEEHEGARQEVPASCGWLPEPGTN